MSPIQPVSNSKVDGALAVASIKSRLNSNELVDALKNLASIPQHKTAFNWQSLGIENPGYEEWPFRIIFSSDGISHDTLKETLVRFYQEQHVPPNRMVDIIHVAGKYSVRRAWQDLEYNGHSIKAGTYFTSVADDLDVASLVVVVHAIQQRLAASRYVPFDYSELFSGMFEMNTDSAQP